MCEPCTILDDCLSCTLDNLDLFEKYYPTTSCVHEILSFVMFSYLLSMHNCRSVFSSNCLIIAFPYKWTVIIVNKNGQAVCYNSSFVFVCLRFTLALTVIPCESTHI